MYYSCVALFGPSSYYTYPVSNYFSVIVSLLSSSFVGFVLGRHLSVIILPSPSTTTKKTVLFIKDHVNRWVFPTLISISVPLLVILAALLPMGHSTYFIYSVIFAPFGALTRYLFSITLNTYSLFPLGTFVANLIGSSIYLGIVALLGYVQISSLLLRQILIGLMQGYMRMSNNCINIYSRIEHDQGTETSLRLYLHYPLTYSSSFHRSRRSFSTSLPLHRRNESCGLE